MVLPKAARCWTYSVAYISAPSASPMPRAATIGRMALSPSMASRKPPTSPMTFSAGTCTSVKTSSPVSTPRTPILWSVRPTSTPSQARSTMKAVTESWARLAGSLVLAKTVYQSASRTPDIQHLVPLRTQPPSEPVVGHAPGPHPHDVAARLGLGQPEGGPQRPVADAGQITLLLLLGAGDHDRPRRQAGQAGASARRCWSTWRLPLWRRRARGSLPPSRRTRPGCTGQAAQRPGRPRRGRPGRRTLCRSPGPAA